MIRFPTSANKKEKDSTVALINIVFLMLIFFLIAGTIVPPLDPEVSPMLSEQTQTAELDHTLSIRTDGKTFFQGNPITPEDFVAQFLADIENEGRPLRLLADQELPAVTLVDMINKLKAAGAPSVRLITERRAE